MTRQTLLGALIGFVVVACVRNTQTAGVSASHVNVEAGLGSGITYGIALTANEDTMYFTHRKSFAEPPRIYQAVLTSGAWTDAQVTSFHTSHGDEYPALSADGTKLFFASRRPVNGQPMTSNRIWSVVRRGSNWGEPELANGKLNAGDLVSGPRPISETLMLFHSRRDGGTIDVYSFDAISSKVERLSINSAAIDGEPTVSARRDIIVFFSDREGGYGRGDLYASRKTGNGWTTPQNLGSWINTEVDEWTPYISPNGRWLYFARLESENVSRIYRIPMSDVRRAN